MLVLPLWTPAQKALLFQLSKPSPSSSQWELACFNATTQIFVGSNETTQGRGQFSLAAPRRSRRRPKQRWIYPPGTSSRQLPRLCPPQNKQLPSAHQLGRSEGWATELEGNTPALATRAAPCPPFTGCSGLKSKPDVSPTHEETCSRDDTLRNAFWTE